MEQNIETPVMQPTPVVTSKPKTGGLKAALAFTTILALGGIGFGVYGMMQSAQKDSKIADLKIQVKNADGSTGTISADKIEITEDKTVVISDPAAGVNLKEYIYLSGWNLKIKIPEEIGEITYAVNYDYDDMSPVLTVSGGLKGMQAMPEYSNVRKCPLGAIHVYSEGREVAPVLKKITTINNRSYYYEGPQANCTSDPTETKMYEAVKKMLTTPSNYSEV